MDQWTKQCGSKELLLLGFWPGNIEEPSLDISMMKGRIKAGKKGILCHRHERLVHLELSDLVVYKQYLDKGFETGKVSPPSADSEDDVSSSVSSAASPMDSDDSADWKPISARAKGKGNGRGKGNAQAPSKGPSPAPSPRKAIQKGACPDCEYQSFSYLQILCNKIFSLTLSSLSGC
jgi:hypothetical protein